MTAMAHLFDFPNALQPAAMAALRAVDVSNPASAVHGFNALVQGEVVSASYRVYGPTSDLEGLISRWTGDARLVTLCIGTRHHDGFFREACARQLLGWEQPWVFPFLIQLLGEYVIEIVEMIAAAVPNADPVWTSAFVRENTAFMALIRQRVISYWDCYHRDRFPTLQAYPGMVALNDLEQMAGEVYPPPVGLEDPTPAPVSGT